MENLAEGLGMLTNTRPGPGSNAHSNAATIEKNTSRGTTKKN